jgi:hypothetical protein
VFSAGPKVAEVKIIGCAALRKFCIDHKLAYAQLIAYINAGKIENISAKRPRPEMRNVIGFEIKEIKNEKFETV